jgi:hypothetical protein
LPEKQIIMAKNLNIEEFKDLYGEWKQSGMTIRSFCDSIGFDENKFYYWKKKLESPSVALAPSTFVPIQMNGQGGKISISTQGFVKQNQASEDVCEIVYPNGVKLRISSGLNFQALRSLILLCQ